MVVIGQRAPFDKLQTADFRRGIAFVAAPTHWNIVALQQISARTPLAVAFALR